MPERPPPSGNSPYRGPPAAPRDKRTRERDRSEQGARDTQPPRREALVETTARADDAPPREQRLYGLNACLAVFAKRPESIRKVWLLDIRIPKFKAVLEFCVKNRVGYTVVGDDDLEKLSSSTHHEGVCFAVMPAPELSLSAWLRDLPAGPTTALWLDGVGNPHNFGAILRSAAHFGVAGVLLPKDSELSLSGAAARIAEGGAEQVPMLRLGRSDNAVAQLQSAGFTLAATVVRGGSALYSTQLPERLVLVIGAEQLGVTEELARAATLRLAIPGSGRVESLNVAAATAVFLGEWWRQKKR